MVFKVRDKLPCFRPVMSANSLIEAGLAVRMTSKSARFSSLKTWDKDRIEVNQILGSDNLGLISPLAMAKTGTLVRTSGRSRLAGPLKP